MKFTGKWMDLKYIILCEVTQSQKYKHGMHSLISDHMKLKKKEDKSVRVSVLLRMGNKILLGGNMETKYRAETEGMTI